MMMVSHRGDGYNESYSSAITTVQHNRLVRSFLCRTAITFKDMTNGPFGGFIV